MKTADELTIETLRKECKRLRKERDWWKLRHELAVQSGRNLTEEKMELRRQLEAEVGPQRGPSSTGKIEAEQRAAIRAMDRELSS